MNRLAAITLLLLIPIATPAQKVISGRVTEKNNRSAVAGANVMVKNARGKIMKLTTTRTDGSFKIELTTWNEEMTINVSMIGMKTYSAPLKENTDKLDIQMEEGNLQLKEVVINADRIRENGDTITYRVSGFAQKQDRTIGDVLQRMPGIDVASNGKIQYQGVDINKFYIEGSDLLNGKYGIATNGISYDDVGAVEVMENHQPMQVLRGFSFSDQAALNLKLKNNAKAVWLVNGHLGGGWATQPSGTLWDGELFLMAVMAGYQTITTLKSNNVGTDLRDQVIDFFADIRNTSLDNYLSIDLPPNPSLKEARTYFNRSWMFSSNHLWKLKSNEIKAQVDYYNHRVTASSSSISTYFLESGDKVITEDRSGTEHGNRLTGKFSIEANRKNYFLNNTLKTELSWNRIGTTMTGTIPNSQHATIPDYYVSNNLKTIRRFGSKHLITFTSVNEWESKPQRLYVDYISKKELSQHLSDHAFYTNERAEYGFYTHGLKLSLEGGLTGYLRGMNSEVKGDIEGIIDESDKGAVTTNYFSLYASPKIEYALGKMEFILSYPLNYTYYKFNQQLGNRSEYFQSPALNVRWKPDPRFSLSVAGGFGRNPMELHDIHDEPILTDYRTFNQGVERFYANSRKHASTRILYRNSVRGIFANAMVVKSWNSTPYKATQHFIEDFIVYSFETSPSRSQSLNAIGNISKTLNFMRGSISANGTYLRMSKSMTSEGLSTLYNNTSWSVGGRINGNITNDIFLSYDIKFFQSQLTVNRQSTSSLDRYIHTFAMTITPMKPLSWQAGGEYYRNELSDGSYKEIFLLDTRLTWHISRRFELSASLNNILNRKTYSYTTYGTLSSLESTRYLRGRECMITLYLKK